MANDVIELARRFEPILHFHPQERFFPSDAKRYIEHCALWKAERLVQTGGRFDKKESWGDTGQPFPRKPMIAHMKIAASKETGEIRPGDRYLGEQPAPNNFPFLIDNNNEQRFLELTGWINLGENGEDPIIVPNNEGVTKTSKNRHSDRDKVEELYNTNTEPELRNSRFWYHAELFDTERLRVLAATSSDPSLLSTVFSRLVDRNPALLCYYFFFPAHDEPLAAPCNSQVSGREFASFAGEWACMAILLVRSSESEQYLPSWIGFTGRRNSGSLQGLDQERRIGMSVHRWGKTEAHQRDLPETVGEHPKLFVAGGTHSLYLEPGTYLVKPYPPWSFPQWCGQFDSPDALDQHLKSHPPPEKKSSTAAWAKILGGLLAGGLVSGFPGLVGGAVWAALEGLPTGIPGPGAGIDAVGTAKPPTGPEPDVAPGPGAFGKVVHPKTLTLTDPPGAEFVKWAADENVEVAGRHYNFIVNRSTQIWWPSDDDRSGYRGRWGPLVTNDPVTRRSGMRFPEFWKMFFIALAKAAPKEFVE